MMTWKRRCILWSLILLAAAAGVQALDFTVTGGWNLTIDETDLSGGAGSDLNPDYLSAADAVVIDVTDTVLPGEPWAITVHQSDIDWEASLHLSVQRSSDGTGTGTITGGTAWIELTDTAQAFFDGTENRLSIQIQLMLSGVSVTAGGGLKTTEVVFTLLDGS